MTVALSIILLITSTIAIQILIWIYQHLSLRNKLKSVPGPKTLPFLGLTPYFRNVPKEDLYMWIMNLCFEYKNGMVLTWVATDPIVHIRRPHQIEVILRSQSLIRKSGIYHFLAYWLGNGLLTSTGNVWHNHRRLITPAFHFAILDEFAGTIFNKVQIFNHLIKAEVGKNPKKPINIFPMAIKFTLDTVCETVMGIDMDMQRQPENAYVKALQKYSELTIFRFINVIYRSDFLFNLISDGKQYHECIETMHAFTTDVINKKIESRKTNKTEKNDEEEDDIGKRKPKAFLDLLMDFSEADEQPLSLKELREQVDTFMFGGHDTTGIAISWVLFCLGNAPEIQKEVQKEIDEVIDDDSKPMTKQQMAQLKYLDRIIKETLRLYPSAPLVSRCLDHDVTIDGYNIPKGVTVAMDIYHLHHDPEVWDQPEKFDPDRFLPENSRKRHAYSYLPFSAGPRNCIGQKFALLVLKISLTSILRKWSILSVKKPSEIKISPEIVLAPYEKKIELYFSPRNEN